MTQKPLTRYPEGSFRELWTIFAPLMFSLLSNNIMLFLDRLILSQHSIEAMNGAAIASLPYLTIQVGIIGIVAIAEVFVGRFNGAGEFHKVGNATWQMIWFSVASCPFFWAGGLWAADWFVGGHDFASSSIPYFQWLAFFGPFGPLIVAVNSFFIGTGKTRFVLITTVFGNVVNIILDYLFVFGIEGWLTSQGAAGAAVATGLAQLLQFILLMIVFLLPDNRKKFLTDNYRWNAPLFKESLRVGIPCSLGHMIEVAAWAVIVRMMAVTGDVHITVMAITQGIYSLVTFVMEGLHKSTTAIAANFMGAKKPFLIKKLRRSTLFLLALFSAFVAIPLVIYPKWLVTLFLSQQHPPSQLNIMVDAAVIACIWNWLYFMFDGVTWIHAGILTAAKDTRFIAVTSALTAWFGALVPIYFLVVRGGGSATLVWALYVFYGSLNALLFTMRADYILSSFKKGF